MNNEPIQNKLCELSRLLDKAISSKGIASDEVLRLSKEIDVLITSFYFGRGKKRKK